MHSCSKLNETVLSTIVAKAAAVAASAVNCSPIERKRHLFAVKSVPESWDVALYGELFVYTFIPLFASFLRSCYLSSPHFSCRIFFISGFVFLIPSLLIVFLFFWLQCCSGDVLFIMQRGACRMGAYGRGECKRKVKEK